jgi:hypothetical protein
MYKLQTPYKKLALQKGNTKLTTYTIPKAIVGPSMNISVS